MQALRLRARPRRRGPPQRRGDVRLRRQDGRPLREVGAGAAAAAARLHGAGGAGDELGTEGMCFVGIS